jgi:hypothetical protein
MRFFGTSAALATLLTLPPSSARATEPDARPAVAVAVGAATIFAGFVIGGTLVAASGENPGKNEAGWLTIESGFALAPLTSHAVVGEWGRGAAFAALPTATTLGSVPVFLGDKDAVGSGTITQQAILWGLFVAGLGTSAIGVIDAAFAPGRALHVAPMLGPHQAGLILGGAL